MGASHLSYHKKYMMPICLLKEKSINILALTMSGEKYEISF
jgi:hypothetical protein